MLVAVGGRQAMVNRVSQSVTKLWSMPKAFLAILVVFGVMLFFNTRFYTAYNLVDLLNSNSIFLILAMGETIVLIAGGVDLSIGGTMTVSGIVTILLINANVPIPIAVL